MKENERRVVEQKESTQSERSAGSVEAERHGRTENRGDFSWYGGQVDEAVLRNIVRLKREQKL